MSHSSSTDTNQNHCTRTAAKSPTNPNIPPRLIPQCIGRSVYPPTNLLPRPPPNSTYISPHPASLSSPRLGRNPLAKTTLAATFRLRWARQSPSQPPEYIHIPVCYSESSAVYGGDGLEVCTGWGYTFVG